LTCILLYESGETIETFGPELLVAVEPIHGLLHRSGDERAGHGATGFPPHDQPGVGEHREVLHHRGQRHGQRPGEFGDGKIAAFPQPRDERAPGRVGEGGESAVETAVGGGWILNHKVKY
jgi:hypothetical protein